MESVLDLFAKQEMEKGMTLGMEKGKALGKEELAAALVNAGVVKLKDVAKAMGRSEEELGRTIAALSVS